MRQFIQLLIIIPTFIICFQIYSFSASRAGADRQSRCRQLGIGYMVIGIFALLTRELLLAFSGLIFIMFAFRLMAKGLDRIDKTVFIDRCDDDRQPRA